MLNPEQVDALTVVRNELAAVRFMLMGLANGCAVGEAEAAGLFSLVDRWHDALVLALDKPTPPESKPDALPC